MTTREKQLTQKESLDLIAMMINKAKDSYHDTGIGAIMWGSVISVCSLVKLSEIHFGFKLPFDITGSQSLLLLLKYLLLSGKRKNEK